MSGLQDSPKWGRVTWVDKDGEIRCAQLKEHSTILTLFTCHSPLSTLDSTGRRTTLKTGCRQQEIYDICFRIVPVAFRGTIAPARGPGSSHSGCRPP